MPEVPEIASRAREHNAALPGKRINGVEILQPKCLNVPVEVFSTGLIGALVESAGYHGKWIQVHTNQGWLLINMGMGGDILLVTPATLPAKHTIFIQFSDDTCLSLSFWWFGHVHYVPEGSLASHAPTAKLGPNVLDLSLEDFRRLAAGQGTSVKTFLLDQSRVAGIGNAYAHDILFLARIHPLRKMDSLTSDEIDALYQGIQDGLRPSLEVNGAFYEKDIYGRPGGFAMERILIGYRENAPCPECGTPIVKIKTGSTSSFICPTHQPFEVVA
ncbi:MAG TPA: DNA-formamidopyrimidine glycosylase family protein [Bellilinea sp.]|nr:DNA-formamidopyrimidine glycosylase family protein [Bellilinea sp.]